jgi:hypothetical protein
MQRFCQLQVLPTARTVSRWLKQFTMKTVERLQRLNAAVIAYVIPGVKMHTMTVDVDGTVVSTGLQVERAPRLQPAPPQGAELLPDHGASGRDDAHSAGAQSLGHRARWASLGFLRELWGQLLGLAPRAAQMRFRMDAAFFREDVLRWLKARGAGFAVKVPFYHWLDLQQYIRRQKNWTGVSQDVSGFVVPAVSTPWGCTVWVAIYRRRVAHQTAKNYQLDLFDPDDGHYEYSAITSNLDYTLANLWYLMAGRGNHEKTIAQLKSGLAFHTVPTVAYAANSAWQQLVALTHNLLTNFQIETGVERRRRSREHTALPVLHTIQTLRFTLFHRAAALVRPGGKSLLRFANNDATQRLFSLIEAALACAA